MTSKAIRSWLFALSAFTAAALLISGCLTTSRVATPGNRAAARTLVWISVDGIRPDYIERAATPFLDGMIREGASSMALQPLFPTLTFASHTTKATGAPADVHGITGNVFYDRRRDRTYGYPNLPWLLEAEPIWTTAARQGIMTAVYGWPLSHRQTGSHAARYFDQAFNRELTDAQRLDHLLRTWRNHCDPTPLGLIMGYMIGPDSAGHLYGPDAPQTAAAMEAADSVLAEFETRLLETWETRRRPGDQLYLLITSDHGMSPVHTLVNPRLCAGLPARGSPVVRVTNANLTHFFFNRIEDPAERETARAAVLENLRRHAFLDIFERHELPPEWRFRHPRRTGDLVAVAPRGYTFNNRIKSAIVPVADRGGPLGMHGYCAAKNPEMLTVAFLQRYPEPLGGHDLGPFATDRLHATAAHILRIESSPSAHPDPVRIP